MPTGRVKSAALFVSAAVLVLIAHFTFAADEVLPTNQPDCQVSSGWLNCTGPKLPIKTNETRLQWNVTGRTSIGPEDFKNAIHLNELIITGETLTSIESITFEKLDNLISLGVIFTGMSEISRPVLRGLDNLKRLDLSNNRFTKLNDAIAGLTELANLRYVSLANNQISNVTEEAVETMSSLSEVDLTNNPLRCDCGIKPLRPYILDYRNHSKRAICFVKTDFCADPPEERNVTVANFVVHNYQTLCAPVSEFVFSIYFLLAALFCAGILFAIQLIVKKLQSYFGRQPKK